MEVIMELADNFGTLQSVNSVLFFLPKLQSSTL